MSTYEEAHAVFCEEMKTLGLFHNDDHYHAIMKYLGPSVHDADASLVACSDPKELEYIKSHFLIGKLGRDANDPILDKAIQEVCHALGKSNRNKHRPTFYYLLMAILQEDFTKLN